MDASLHYLAPHVLKVEWTALGDEISKREKSLEGRVSGDKWISLRLDGSSFSSTVKALRSGGILEAKGFSETFATAMQNSCVRLMEKFGAKLGYTQSDEMIILIPPQNIVRGVQ